MNIIAPKIDSRDQKLLAEQIRAFIVQYAPEWPDVAAVAADLQTEALTQLFARLLENTIEKLNRVPDKNFLTFLEMLGFDLTAPRAAQAPLVFTLADGAAPTFVPPGTQVTAAGSEDDPIVFETREALTVTAPAFGRLLSLNTDQDRYTDHAKIITPGNTAAESLFEGRQVVPHRIFLGQDTIFSVQDPATIELDIKLDYPIRFTPEEWSVRWYAYTDASPDPVELTPYLADPLDTESEEFAASRLLGDGTVVFQNISGLAQRAISGFGRKALSQQTWPVLSFERFWIYADLETSIPVERYVREVNISPDVMFADVVQLNSAAVFRPFGTIPVAGDNFFIASQSVFSREKSTGVMTIRLDDNSPAPDTSDVVLSLDYWDGDQWQNMGLMSQAGVTDAGSYNLVDTTNAFTRDGEIYFTIPAVQSTSINSNTGLYLRVRVISGDYGSSATLKPPVFAALLLEHTSIPRIESINTRVIIDPDDALALETASFNGSLLDTSKDFRPFGRNPEFNDTFYFASSEALSNTDTTISIQINLSAGVDLPDTTSIDLQWEFWNGSRWALLGSTSPAGVAVAQGEFEFRDLTNAFTQSGVVEFASPPIAERELFGETDYWIRVRILSGDYGTDELENLKPPSIETFHLEYSFTAEAPPDAVVTENDFFLLDDTDVPAHNTANPDALRYIEPFSLSQDTNPSLYIGFDADIANLPLSIYFPLLTSRFNALLQTDEESPPVLAWEYWTGTSWATLVVSDATRALSRREIAQIQVPGNHRSRPVFGDERHWIRIRLSEGNYPLFPSVSSLFANTVFADHLASVSEELLGSSNGEPNQKFTLSQTPVLPGAAIVVREEALTEEDRAVILSEEGEDAINEITDSAGNVLETRVRWHRVVRFEFSGPQSRHYTLDPRTGEILFGNGNRGFVPPVGRNNVLAESYQFGGGLPGNVAANTITEIRDPFPQIDSVTNPRAADGGVERESLDSLRLRGPRAIKNRGRAVTLEDFEAIVRESTGEVARVRALPTTDSDFKFRPGYITLVIVPNSEDAKPFPTRELIASVQEFVDARSASQLVGGRIRKINVLGPEFIQVSVEVDVVYKNIAESKIVEARIRDALNEFLNPARGGPDGEGWEFGRNVYLTEVYQVVEGVEGVDHAAKIVLRASEQIFNVALKFGFIPPVPFPAQSSVTFTGVRETSAGTIPITTLMRLVERVREDEQVNDLSVVGFKEGDVAVLRNPDGDFPLNVIVSAVSGGFLEIETAFAQTIYEPGSTVELSGGGIKSTLLERIEPDPLNGIAGLALAIPEATDRWELVHRDVTFNRRRGTVSGISDDVSMIFLDTNYLVYTGLHAIRSAQESIT